MKRFSRLLAASVMLLAAPVFAADEVKLDGIKCPVSKAPVKAGTEVDYKGGKVYFCCNNCPKAFEKDTAKFATKANMQLVATGQAKQVKCPIAGRALNPDMVVKVDGTDVTLCCAGCKGKLSKASADEKVKMVFEDAAFDKSFKVAEKK